eukprot:ctg_2355.g567
MKWEDKFHRLKQQFDGLREAQDVARQEAARVHLAHTDSGEEAHQAGGRGGHPGSTFWGSDTDGASSNGSVARHRVATRDRGWQAGTVGGAANAHLHQVQAVAHVA